MSEPQKFSAELRQIIKEHKQFLLLTHYDPDGDALGSTCGLGYILRRMKKQVTIGLCDVFPGRYEFLICDDGLRFQQQERVNLAKFDAVIVLDSSTPDRLDKFEGGVRALPEGVPLVNIDHHGDNSRYGTLNIVDCDAASTSQMIVELLGARALDSQAAFCLYAGIVYDTGSFRHGVNMRRAHEAVTHCLAWPIDSKQVYNRLFSLETEAALRLFSRALSRLAIVEKGRVAYMYLTSEDYREFKADPDVTNGFINRLVMLDGAQIVLFFNEVENNQIRVALRANIDFSVGDFAAMFGGGGHTRAAGCRIEGIIEKVIERMIRSLHLALDIWDRHAENKGGQ